MALDLPPLGGTERGMSLSDVKSVQLDFHSVSGAKEEVLLEWLSRRYYFLINMLIPWVSFQPCKHGGGALEPAFYTDIPGDSNVYQSQRRA